MSKRLILIDLWFIDFIDSGSRGSRQGSAPNSGYNSNQNNAVYERANNQFTGKEKSLLFKRKKFFIKMFNII